jgi:ferredoxin-NADP reductase
MRLEPKIPVIITAIAAETPTVKRFTLAPEDGKPLPAFSGGAHITTYVQTTAEVLERHYSLVSDPVELGYYQIAVRLQDDSRGGSAYWHREIRTGDRLMISQPKNHFPLSFRAKHHVFYAAGIGITPFLAMMADLTAKGGSFELHYAARSQEHCPFYHEIRSRYGERAHFYFSADGCRMTPSSMAEQPIGTHLYFCGPQTLVQQFREAALTYGYPGGAIHYELFTPPAAAQALPFQAVLRHSGRILDVPPEQTLLDALLLAGIHVPYSCRVGGCGTCELEVLEGEVEHRDLVLSEREREANDRIITCVSRARSKQIVLNL